MSPNITTRSLVGMTMGARKRAAQSVAVEQIEPLGITGVAQWIATWSTLRAAAGASLRIGQRLRPCPGCHTCMPGVKGWHIDKVRGRFKMPTVAWSCDGSGVLPARARKVRR